MKNSETGFNLLELLMALAIIGILASVAAPSFSSILSDIKLAGAAEKIVADMAWARTVSIGENVDIVMVLSASGTDSWCYGFDDAQTSCNCALTTTALGACTVGGVNRRNDESGYGSTTLNSLLVNNDITFQSRGVADDAGSLTLTSLNHSVTINITRLGRGNICSGDLSQYKKC